MHSEWVAEPCGRDAIAPVPCSRTADEPSRRLDRPVPSTTYAPAAPMVLLLDTEPVNFHALFVVLHRLNPLRRTGISREDADRHAEDTFASGHDNDSILLGHAAYHMHVGMQDIDDFDIVPARCKDSRSRVRWKSTSIAPFKPTQDQRPTQRQPRSKASRLDRRTSRPRCRRGQLREGERLQAIHVARLDDRYWLAPNLQPR